jgi:hypothetical protein
MKKSKKLKNETGRKMWENIFLSHFHKWGKQDQKWKGKNITIRF